MKYLSQLSLLLPLAFFVGAAIQYVGLSSSDYTFSSMVIRDGFIMISLILSLPLVYKQKWASDRNVLRGLRHLFFLVLITSAILFLSGNRLASLRDRFFDTDFLRINLGDNVLIISWAFFAIVFMLIALGTLRNLIYIKRKKSTAAIFTWLMIFLLLYSLTSLPEYYTDSILNKVPLFKYLNYAVLFILINFSVVNSFRVSWINYLNKKQKIACFWGGLILVPVQILFVLQFRHIHPIVSFSPLLERFIEMGMVFITIYLCMSFLALLAHLPTAKLYDRKIQQIQSLHDLSRALSSEFNWNKLVRTIVKLASEVTEAEYAWLELYGPKKGALALISSKQLIEIERKSWNAECVEPLIEWFKRTKETMICNQINKNDLVKNLRTWKKDIGSLIAVPMIASDRVVGFLYVGKRFEFGFEQDDAEMLRAFSDHATIAVENARLVEESIVKERLEQELKIAHEAQMKLLPKQMPTIEGIELDAVCVTANEVGGDYYDFFKLGDAKLGIVIGDVSGKGPSAAFYMAEVKGIMEALSKEVLSPEEMLIAANEILYKNFDRKTFISLIYGILDAKSKSFTFCRAGHCPIFFVRGEKDECQRLEPKGLGVGLDPGPLFEKSLQQERIKLKRGDTLLLYTDGVTDARNRDGDEFGEKRLEDALLAVRDKVSIDIKKHLIHTIYSFFDGQNAYDDLTFIIIKAV
ncbi:SpoIIE family protein phosphatase [candidate division KSB1 bacterium]|nr:SpoIIE family protein phosphatase [candidate division KSB1 bacterium]RQW06579.1 MAG: GAF domain-containing protein [candidate division KSB1 bacterium]